VRPWDEKREGGGVREGGEVEKDLRGKVERRKGPTRVIKVKDAWLRVRIASQML